MSEPRKSFKDLGKLGKKIKGKKASLEDFIPVFHALVDEIEHRGLDTEGILRISGSMPEITALKKSLLKGSPPDISKMDIHVITGLLKTLLRELPEPLLLFSNYDPLLKASVMSDPSVKLKVTKTIINNLPPANREVLCELLTLAVHITNHEDVNRMSSHNIAVVLGPTIMRAQTESLESMMRDSMQVIKVVEDMIESFSALFDNKTITIQRPVSLNPQEAEFLRKRAASLFPASQDKSVEDLRNDVTNMKTQITELESRLAEGTQEIEILHSYKSSLETKLHEENEKVLDLQEQMASLQAKLEETNSIHSETVFNMKTEHERHIASLETQLNDKTSIISTLEKANTEAKQQISSLKTTSASLKEKNNLLESKLTASDSQNIELNSKLQTLQSQISDLEAKFAASEKRANTAESKLADMEPRLNKAEKAVAEGASKLKEKQEMIERLEKRNEQVTSDYNSLQKAKGDTEVAQANALAAATNIASQSKENEESKQALNSKIRNLETEISNLQNQLKTSVDRANKLEKDLQKTEGDHKKAIENLTKTEASMKKLGDEKRAAELETKKALLEMKALQAEIESLHKELSDTVDASSKAEAEERSRSAANIKKVREERSAVEIQLKKTQLEMASLESTIKSLTTAKATLTEENSQLKAEQKSHNSALKKIQNDKANIESEWRKVQILRETETKKYIQDRAAAESTIKKLQTDKSAIEADLKKLQTEKSKLETEKSKLAAENEALKSDSTQLKNEVKRLSGAPKSPEAELQKVVAEKDRLSVQLKKTQDELKELKSSTTSGGSPLAEELKKSQELNKKLAEENKRLSTPTSPRSGGVLSSIFGKNSASSSSPKTTPLSGTQERSQQAVEKELSEQLFSWMTLSLKLEAMLQERPSANFDSQGLLSYFLAEKIPWPQWPELIQKHMEGKA